MCGHPVVHDVIEYDDSVPLLHVPSQSSLMMPVRFSLISADEPVMEMVVSLNEQMRLECGDDKPIHIETATSRHLCEFEDVKEEDLKETVKDLCHHRTCCIIAACNDFLQNDPCPDSGDKNLTVEYKCHEGELGNDYYLIPTFLILYIYIYIYRFTKLKYIYMVLFNHLKNKLS